MRRTTEDRCPCQSMHLKEARVRRFVRHPQCSLQSVESAGHWKVISIMEELGKSEESSMQADVSLIKLCDRALALHQLRSGSQAAAYVHCIIETIRARSEHLSVRSEHQPQLAARRNSQINRNQVKSSDQK